MDKETLSNYGWIVICVLVLAVMIALAGPFGNFVADAVKSTTQGLFDVNQGALNAAGITIDDNAFVEGENGDSGDGSVIPKATLNDYTWSELQTLAQAGLTAEEYQNTYNINLGNKKDNKYILVDYDNYGGFVFMFNNSNYSMTGSFCLYSDENSQMARATENLYSNLADSELKTAIKKIDVLCKKNDLVEEYDAYECHFFIPSITEFGVTTRTGDTTIVPAPLGEGTTFDYFTTPSNINTIAQELGTIWSNSGIWSRTYSIYNYQYTVFSNGNYQGVRKSGIPSMEMSAFIIPAFVIG